MEGDRGLEVEGGHYLQCVLVVLVSVLVKLEILSSSNSPCSPRRVDALRVVLFASLRVTSNGELQIPVVRVNVLFAGEWW